MGMRYMLFRISYAIQHKLGIVQRKFPVNPSFRHFITRDAWREQAPPFFFEDKTALKINKQEQGTLKERVQAIKTGTFTFFSSKQYDLGTDYDWMTNPDSGHRYDKNKHWSKVQDYAATAGDIKFVWEKARFGYILDIIRYDFHFNDDQASFVLSEIEDFIDKNPINQGPNYKCSQETSLRILNWTFALYYYKHHPALTPSLFDKILNTIYWQLHHVYGNINFSRIAVRNNHVITESLMLFLSGLLFPFIPETARWSSKGKNWFEEEIDYQIYDDGTFLQFSMNYHRVVVQLLTWGIRLAELNDIRFRESIYTKAQKSLHFLEACLDKTSGQLPNYGSNDGALFFRLTEDDYRDYRSQLSDLKAVLMQKVYWASESQQWYGIDNLEIVSFTQNEITQFQDGGYYIHQEEQVKTFIKCGKYKDRPAQADNMHLDIWVNGINYLWDTGSFKYNTTPDLLKHFMGTAGHNTIAFHNADQMLKGGRFIWYYWIKDANGTWKEEDGAISFKGKFKGFRHLGELWHTRKVTKHQGKLMWDVQDNVEGINGKKVYQYWHVNPDVYDHIMISSQNDQGVALIPTVEDSWYSGYYGVKTLSKKITFTSVTQQFNTKICIV